MIGNCFFPLERHFRKKEEDCKLFLIFSAKLKIKAKEMGKNGVCVIEGHTLICGVPSKGQ